MITVCYSGNKKIFEGLLLSVLSLADKATDSLNILVMSMDIPDVDPRFRKFSNEQIALLDKVVKEKNPESRATLIDVTELYRIHLAHSKNANSGYTPYTLLRLLLDMIPEAGDKVIYTDIDTMFSGDIKELYDVDISGYEFGAVRDHMGKVFIGPNYCNAGVLLLNMEEIRRTHLFERAREMVVRKKMIMPDQTALNKLAHAKKYLPRRFNEQRGLRPDTVIKHFCKGIKFYPLFFRIYNYKQWNREMVHKKLGIHEFDYIYELFDKITASADINK